MYVILYCAPEAHQWWGITGFAALRVLKDWMVDASGSYHLDSCFLVHRMTPCEHVLHHALWVNQNAWSLEWGFYSPSDGFSI